MPRCLFTQKFMEFLNYQDPPRKYIHYHDEDIAGFILEYRHSRKGTWYFKYRDMENKTRLCRIGTLATMPLSEARVRAHVLQQLAEKGGDPKINEATSVGVRTLEEFVWEQYLPYAKMKKRSWELDQRILRLHVLPIFGQRKLDQIRHIEIIAWQRDLKNKGLATGSCNRMLTVLKAVFNAAVRWGILSADKNASTGVTLFMETATRERYLSPEEARKLLQALVACRNHLSAQAIQLLLFTGARKSEILTAQWKHVDMERRFLTIPLSKSGKIRRIPLSDAAVAVLQSIPRHGDVDWIFFNPTTGSHLNSVFTLWKRIRTTLGLKDFRLHDLRHSFASFLVNSGRSLYEVQTCLGHQSPRMTMRYAHLAPQSLISAANTVEAAIGFEI